MCQIAESTKDRYAPDRLVEGWHSLPTTVLENHGILHSMDWLLGAR